MQILKQQIIVIRQIKEYHDLSANYKLKKLLSDPSTTIDIVKEALYPQRMSRTRMRDDMNMKDIAQDKSEEPVISIKLVVSFVDKSTKEVIIWDSVSGFNKAEYELTKSIADKMGELVAKEDLILNG